MGAWSCGPRFRPDSALDLVLVRGLLSVPAMVQAASAMGESSDARELVALAQKVLSRVAAVDLKSYEPLDPEAALDFMSHGAVMHLLSNLESAGRIVEALGGEGPPRQWEPQPQELVAAPVFDSFCEDLDLGLQEARASLGLGPGQCPVPPEQVRLVCNRTVQAFRAAAARLRRILVKGDKWALITEGEEAKRKTQVGLRVCITMALPDEWVDGAFAAEIDELTLARSVRECVLDLRQQLLESLPKTDVPLSELVIALRNIRIALLGLYSSRRYEFLRAKDRFAMEQLRNKIGAWLKELDPELKVGRALAGQAEELAGHFGRINQRGSLVRFDRQCAAALVSEAKEILDRDGEQPTTEQVASFAERMRQLIFREPKLARTWEQLQVSLQRAQLRELVRQLASLAE